jgi:molybdate transport system substrate-binding protein
VLVWINRPELISSSESGDWQHLKDYHKLMLLIFVCCFILTSRNAAAQENGEIVLFAASSLTDAFEEIGAAFEDAQPGATVTFNFGGSSTLAAQLAEGAPADVFASANSTQMNAACEAGRIASVPAVFAHNRLVIVLPADNPAGIEKLADLALPGIKLLLAAPDVPVRDYTDMMLEQMEADSVYGEAYREGVLANLVSEEDNVRQVVAKVALGEADAGVVYQSDITPDVADAVVTLEVPDEYNTIALYPIALTTEGENPATAQAFIDYVLSEDGQAVLEKWGFIPVLESASLEATVEAAMTVELTPETAEAADNPMPACQTEG